MVVEARVIVPTGTVWRNSSNGGRRGRTTTGPRGRPVGRTMVRPRRVRTNLHNGRDVTSGTTTTVRVFAGGGGRRRGRGLGRPLVNGDRGRGGDGRRRRRRRIRKRRRERKRERRRGFSRGRGGVEGQRRTFGARRGQSRLGAGEGAAGITRITGTVGTALGVLALLRDAAAAGLLQTQTIGNLTGLGKAFVGVLVVFLAESSQRMDLARHGRFSSTHFGSVWTFLGRVLNALLSSGRPCFRTQTSTEAKIKRKKKLF